jgi:hypothetical protein
LEFLDGSFGLTVRFVDRDHRVIFGHKFESFFGLLSSNSNLDGVLIILYGVYTPWRQIAPALTFDFRELGHPALVDIVLAPQNLTRP